MDAKDAVGDGQTIDVGFDRVVLFYLGGRRFALPIEHVQEIQQAVALTPLPDEARELVGMINLRGVVVPVIDLRILIGMEEATYGAQTPLVICAAHSHLVALVVDEVEDVVLLPEGCAQEPSSLYSLADKLIGVCRIDDELVFLLDIERLVTKRSASAAEAVLPEGG